MVQVKGEFKIGKMPADALYPYILIYDNACSFETEIVRFPVELTRIRPSPEMVVTISPQITGSLWPKVLVNWKLSGQGVNGSISIRDRDKGSITTEDAIAITFQK